MRKFKKLKSTLTFYDHDELSVPDPTYHRYMQPSDRLQIARPNCFLMAKEEAEAYLPDKHLKRLIELYRSCYGSTDEKTSEDLIALQRDTDKLDLMVLNFGQIGPERKICIGGTKKLSKSWSNDPEYCVLPHLVLNHGAHISVLMEADGFKDQGEVCKRYGMIGTVVKSIYKPEAPAIACFVKGSKEYGTGIELIRHLDVKYEKPEALVTACLHLSCHFWPACRQNL